MIVVVCGTRTLLEVTTLEALHKSPAALTATLAVLGDCKGPDNHAKAWFTARGIKGVVLQARWDQEGKAAGPNRNARLIRRAQAESERRGVPAAVVAVWDGQSTGTADTIQRAQAVGLPLEVWLVKGAPPVLARPSQVAALLDRLAKGRTKD